MPATVFFAVSAAGNQRTEGAFCACEFAAAKHESKSAVMRRRMGNVNRKRVVVRVMIASGCRRPRGRRVPMRGSWWARIVLQDVRGVAGTTYKTAVRGDVLGFPQPEVIRWRVN